MGNGGSDILLGHGGHDFISGGRGSDMLVGGSGYDRLFAGERRDTSKDVVRAVDGSPDEVECGGSANQDSIFLDRFDYFQEIKGFPYDHGSCENVSRLGTAGLVFIPYGSRVEVSRDGSTQLTFGCPGDGPVRCGGQVELLVRGRIRGEASVSIERDPDEGATMSYELPTRIQLRRGQRSPATVVVKTRDAAGEPFELRTPVTLHAL